MQLTIRRRSTTTTTAEPTNERLKQSKWNLQQFLLLLLLLLLANALIPRRCKCCCCGNSNDSERKEMWRIKNGYFSIMAAIISGLQLSLVADWKLLLLLLLLSYYYYTADATRFAFDGTQTHQTSSCKINVRSLLGLNVNGIDITFFFTSSGYLGNSSSSGRSRRGGCSGTGFNRVCR